VKIESIGDGVRFTVRVQPRASRNELAGSHGDAIKIRLTAPPVEGAANTALIAFLSRALGVPKSSVRIARGERSRSKVVEVIGIDPDSLRQVLGEAGR
jgi:uncharacterized protein (TIGR00251 family)